MIVDQPARDEYVSVLSRRRNDLDEEEKSKRALARMEEKHLDLILVPLGLMVMSIYHLWLFIRIVRNPKGTVIGINAFARERWVKFMMTDPLKNGVLAVQTIRNNIMASTLLATTAITLSSLIGVVVSSTKDSSTAAILIYGNTSPLVSAIKYFTILLCFLVAFLFNVQSIRYYAHTSILISVAPPKELEGSVSKLPVAVVISSVDQSGSTCV
ncbi:hypothetical protein H6P81_008968 [Aristolochia fimbriata]|uniref:Uncharacterized protein n=1 Tax=Aristolochia fimbriata TaxID=158543 RepID=A0AAV7EJI3_ARIFI|nr:hypothetical protein H6P81_008968 [Aristolochia fimbriata]